MQHWLGKSAADLGRAIGAGDLDPVALTEAFLERARGADGARIYARLTGERALAEAGAARARAQAGQRRGPLDGVPVSWKDLFDSAGAATEAGTKLMAGRIPARDAEVLARAGAAGLVCLGKTHLSEIAFSGLGVNPMTETSPNRAFPGCAPGGSSSGAAASLAYNMAALAIGTDTGGSVRIPAAWNDLVGLKTAHGLLPDEGVVPLAAGFDTTGPLARTVEDAALALAALGGPETDLRGASLAGRKLALLQSVVMDGLAPDVAAGFARACDALRDVGAQIEAIEAPELDEAFAISNPLYTADAWAFWGPWIEAAPGQMWHHIEDRVRAGSEVLAADYLRVWARLRALRAEWAARAAGYDAVICPSVAILPPKVERLLADDDYYREINLLALRNTRVGNLMGLCGLSLPSGVSGVGVMLNGLPGQEGRLLRLGAALEAALA